MVEKIAIQKWKHYIQQMNTDNRRRHGISLYEEGDQ